MPDLQLINLVMCGNVVNTISQKCRGISAKVLMVGTLPEPLCIRQEVRKGGDILISLSRIFKPWMKVKFSFFPQQSTCLAQYFVLELLFRQ